jgi:hypothetical protein
MAPGVLRGLSFLGAVATCVACGSVSRSAPSVPRAIPAGSCLVVGFLGGNDRRDDASKGVRRLALELARDHRLYAETFENRRVRGALGFVEAALDADRSGGVDLEEASRAHVVVYGQSLGGWATLVFARLLGTRAVPVQLTLQIDSVGWGDAVVPSNVRWAANLYQNDGAVIAGQHPIRPADPARTTIVGEWEFDYDRPPGSEIRIDGLPWHKTLFRADHARMDRDPRVWSAAARLVRDACAGRVPGAPPAAR